MLFDVFQAGISLFREVHETRWNPYGLEGDILLFFRYFKKSIDSKDVQRLQSLISDNYYSKSYVNKNKKQLISWFQTVFQKMPSFLYPSLEIEICKAPEVRSEDTVYLVIRPTLNIHILGINLASQLFGTNNRIAMLIERNASSGLFSLINMEEV
ncbi:MAG: hypothetical protein KME49_07755 [Brasilonema octagenarum HA4186-MV1]|jgi:hypothetical protein|nr:hypothetical protein [Brasilonema octagenarum HA4186-MV1]